MVVLKVILRTALKFVVINPLISLAIVVLLGAGLIVSRGYVSDPTGAQAGALLTETGAPVLAKGNLPAPSSTESFMKGQATFNADLVWNALSNDLHESLQAQGSSKDELQQQLNQYKQEGRQVVDFTYVGGYSAAPDKAFYFYVASILRPDLGGQADQVFFAFTVDRNGMVVQVE